MQGLYDNISVTLSRQEVFPEYIVREMLVIKSGSEKASTGNLGLKVFQIQYLKWPEQNVPTVTNSVLEIANLVQKIQISTGNSAITVMCKCALRIAIVIMSVILYKGIINLVVNR